MDSQPEEFTVRIASFNIRKGIRLDCMPYTSRICTVIDQINPEILVLKGGIQGIRGRNGVLARDQLKSDFGYELVEMGKKQLMALANYTSKKKHPIIIAGDFNHWKQTLPELGPASKLVTSGLSFHTSYPLTLFDRFVSVSSVDCILSWVHVSEESKKASDYLPAVADTVLGKTE